LVFDIIEYASEQLASIEYHQDGRFSAYRTIVQQFEFVPAYGYDVIGLKTTPVYRFVIYERSVSALQVFNENVQVTIEKFTRRNEDNGVVRANAGIVDTNIGIQ